MCLQAARAERDEAREKLSELETSSQKAVQIQKEIEAERSQGVKLQVILESFPSGKADGFRFPWPHILLKPEKSRMANHACPDHALTCLSVFP